MQLSNSPTEFVCWGVGGGGGDQGKYVKNSKSRTKIFYRLNTLSSGKNKGSKNCMHSTVNTIWWNQV